MHKQVFLSRIFITILTVLVLLAAPLSPARGQAGGLGTSSSQNPVDGAGTPAQDNGSPWQRNAHAPHGKNSDPNKAYLAATWGDDSVHFLDANLVDTGSFPTGDMLPNGLATDGAVIYTGHFMSSSIRAFDYSGSFLYSFSDPNLGGLQGLELVNGELAAYSGGGIFFYTTDGVYLRSITPPGVNAEGLAFDGTLLWASGQELYGMDPADGTLISSLPNPVIGNCDYEGTGLAANAPGQLTVACENGNWYIVSTADGSVIGSGDNDLQMFGLGYQLDENLIGAVYIRSTAGSPWGTTTNEEAMDAAFGVGSWLDLRYELVNPAELFTDSTDFIFMEGSDNNADELEAFLSANQALLETWVAQGGRLLLNAAPTEGDGMSYGFGGVMLSDEMLSDTGVAVDPLHPIFNGPFLPAGPSYTGMSFSHATVTGGGITNLMIGDNGVIPLAELSWGSGLAAFGAMTTTNFHDPDPNAFNLRVNLLLYTAGLTPPVAEDDTSFLRLFTTDSNAVTDTIEIDPFSGAELNRFALPEPSGFGPDGLAFDGDSLWFITGDGSDTLYELDPDTGAVRDADVITSGSGNYDGLAAAGGLVYILDYVNYDIHIFDPAVDAVTGTLDIDGQNGVQPYGGLAGMAAPDALIFTANDGNIYELDPNSGLVTHSFAPYQPQFNYFGVAVLDGQIYLSAAMNGTVEVYDRPGSLLRDFSIPYSSWALGGDDQFQPLGTDEDTPFQTGNVLANDYAPSGQPLHLESFDASQVFGVLLSNGDGTFSYDPGGAFETLAPGEVAYEVFTYVASDGILSDQAAVTITVSGVDDAPIAFPDEYTAYEDTLLEVPAPGVLWNDFDPEGDPFGALLLEPPAVGSLSFSPDGAFSYAPVPESSYIVTFTYQISQAAGSPSASYFVGFDEVEFPEGTVVDGYMVDTLDGVPIPPLSFGFEIGGEPSDAAHFSVFGPMTTTYNLPPNIEGPASGILAIDLGVDVESAGFSFVVACSGDISQAITVTALAEDMTPVGTYTFDAIDFGFGFSENWVDILPGAPFRSLQMDFRDECTAFVVDNLTYSSIELLPTLVTIEVLPVNDVPIVEAGADQTADEGQELSFAGAYSDPDGEAPAVDVTWDFGDGTTASGTLNPTHIYADDGDYTVTLAVTDEQGGVGTDSLLVTVSNVAPALEPLADLEVQAREAFSVTAAFFDPGLEDVLTLQVDWGDGQVESFELPGGTTAYELSHSYATAGVYTVIVRLSDGDAGMDEITFTVTVTGYWTFLPMTSK